MAQNGKVKATIVTTEEGTECKVSYSCTPQQQQYLILTMIESLAERRNISIMDTSLGLMEILAAKEK